MMAKKYKVTVKHAFDKKYLYKKCTSLYSASCLSHVPIGTMVQVHSAPYWTVSVSLQNGIHQLSPRGTLTQRWLFTGEKVKQHELSKVTQIKYNI